jgi:hypothetical protein
MVRISKQQEIRSRCPKRCRPPAKKTGPKKDAISYKAHPNAVEGKQAEAVFIPKIQ